MPDYGFGALAIGTGAQAGLQDLIKRRLLELQMALQEQAQRENSDYRNRVLSQGDENNRLNRESIERYRLAQLGVSADRNEDIAVKNAADQTPNKFELPISTAARFKARGMPVSGPSQQELVSPLANEELQPYRFEGNVPNAANAAGFKQIGPVTVNGKRVLQFVDPSDPNKILGERDAPDPERGTTPYFTFPVAIDPNTGQPTVFRGNARTGQLDPVSDQQGRPVQKPYTGTEQTKVNDMAEAINALSTVRSLYNPELIGPVAGRVNRLKTKMPENMTDIPSGFADLAPAVANYRNRIIKAITGAQMSEPEANRIREQIPELWDRPEVFEAKMKLAEQLTQYAFKRWARAEQYRQNGWDGVELQRQLDAEMPMPQSAPSSSRVPLSNLGR